MDETTRRPVELNAVVAKSNDLIPKMSNFDLSEFRLISFCLGHYDSRNGENRQFVARVDELQKLFKMDEKSAYAVVRKTMAGIAKKPLEIEKPTARGRIKKCSYQWFSAFEYEVGTGEFTFCIGPEALPYMLELKGNFTKYRLQDVYQFKAASTWKMYENLKKWAAAGQWEVDLDELRLLLGVAGKYARWQDFKKYLTKAITEINDVSDIKVEIYNPKKTTPELFLQIKRGRRIAALYFEIRGKKPDDEDDEVIDIETSEHELYTALAEVIHPKTAKKYAALACEYGKIDVLLKKLPKIVERAAGHSSSKKYLTGAIKSEILQQSLPFDDVAPAPEPDYTAALDCWHGKKRQCSIRRQSATPRRKLCRICIDKIPADLDKD